MVSKTVAAKKPAVKKATAAKPPSSVAPALAVVSRPKPTEMQPMSCRFFLADDIRQEMEGKITAVGLYVDDVVVAQMRADQPDPSPAMPAAIPSLVILARVSLPPGPHVYKVRMSDPSGSMAFNEPPPRTVVTTDNAVGANIILRFQPLPFAGFGNMKLSMSVDDRVFEFLFEIRRQNVPELGEAVPT